MNNHNEIGQHIMDSASERLSEQVFFALFVC